MSQFMFNRHSSLDGKHAFLSASKYSWLNYSDEKIIESYINAKRIMEGTRLHALAAELIMMKVKLPKTKATLNMYVNDCIGFHMKPEQLLFYSDKCFGTADAISFNKKKLRIFDLKTGTHKASPNQLCIYAALFCLEYKKDPKDIDIELRIYQNNEVSVIEPSYEFIQEIMDKIRRFSNLIDEFEEDEDHAY